MINLTPIIYHIFSRPGKRGEQGPVNLIESSRISNILLYFRKDFQEKKELGKILYC